MIVVAKKYICVATVPVISSIWYLHQVLVRFTFVIYACAFPEPRFKVSFCFM